MRFSDLRLEGTRVVVLSAALGSAAAGLSPAEREVALLMGDGKTNAEIAALRGTSVRTVANQARAIFAKLGVRGRREVAAALYGGRRAR